jgi:hypothetical protein
MLFMKYRIVLNFTLLIFSLFSINCATLLKGYEDTITLKNAPDSIRVVTHDGIEIKVGTENHFVLPPKGGTSLIFKETKVISLRNNKDYILKLKYQDKEKIIAIYPKIGFGWAFLDFICGIIPSFYDAYTGSWNRFPDVDASF